MIKILQMMRSPFALSLLGAFLSLSLILASTGVLYVSPRDAIHFKDKITCVFPDGTIHDIASNWYTSCVNNKDFQKGTYIINSSVQLNTLIINSSVQLNTLERSTPLTLVFPYIGATAISVKVNGTHVGSQGDMFSGNSNIWPSVKLFDIPCTALKEYTRIEIQLFGLYEAGLIKAPYLLSRPNNNRRFALMQFLSEGVIWLLCGAIFMMGLVVFFTGFVSLPKIDAHLVLGLAAIITAIFMTDFITFDYLPLPLVDFRRMNVLLRHVASLLFLWGFLMLIEKPLTRFSWAFTGAQVMCMLTIMFPADMSALKNMYTITYLTLLPLPFYVFFQLLRHKDLRNAYSVLISGVFVALLCTVNDILSEILCDSTVYVSHYGFMVMVLMTSAFIVIDFINNFRQLLFEKQRAELFREESLHDPMTRVFNRNILPFIQQQLSGHFSVLTIDLDNFKHINDTYGHHTGDLVLNDVVQAMGRVFRHNDYIIRFGGDEFLVILPRCPESKSKRLSEQLQREIENARIQIKVQSETGFDADEKFISYSASIGLSHADCEKELTQKQFQHIISQADSHMYEIKRAKKKTINHQ